jgi:hypothetical protein
MISRKDLEDVLKGKLPHIDNVRDFAQWQRDSGGFCTVNVERFTNAIWMTYLRQCDRVFFPEDAINSFVLIAAGRFRYRRVALGPGMVWKMG